MGFVSPNSCVEALPHRVPVFGDRAFRRQLRLHEVLRVEPGMGELVRRVDTRCGEEEAVREPGGSSAGTRLAGTLVLDSPQTVRKHVCGVSHPVSAVLSGQPAPMTTSS